MEPEKSKKLFGGKKLIFKAIGIILIIMSATALGMSKSSEFKRRVKYLDSMQSCVLQFENEIRFTQTPILHAFESISDLAYDVIKDIFLYAAHRMNEASGETVASIWQESVNKFTDRIYDEDAELFSVFSECLGSSDLEGHLKCIDMFSSKLAQNCQKAKDQFEKNNKLFKNLGIYSGILLAILFV